MRKILLYIVVITCIGCRTQHIVSYKDLRFISNSYQGTQNKNFINKRIVFLSVKDSVFFNIKIAWDADVKNINDPGIFYNCQLNKDTLYTFTLKKATVSAIPVEYNSYYLTNGQFPSAKSSKFKEVKKNTPYNYVGNTGMFIDINDELYTIEKMTPTTRLYFPTLVQK
jgi:hypothetical protein